MSAADFLFTPSIQRVLAVVLAQPDKAFTLQELLRVAASGRGSTQQQIDRLVEAGVLAEEPRRGHQRSIKANTRFFLYPELRSIAHKTFGLTEPLRHALAAFAGQIERAFLFGSVAKGSDGTQSDIDVLVVGTAPVLDVSEALQELEQRIGRTIHLSLYEPAEWQALTRTDPVLAQIANGPQLTLIAPHDDSPP